MAFSIIGLGLNPPEDITLRGLNLIKKAKKVYLESYTNKLQAGLDKLNKAFSKEIILISRQLLEETETLVREARELNVALLVLGDPLLATTHFELLLRMKQAKIKVNVIHNASINEAILDTGLQGYKFGRTVSLPHEKASSPYDYIQKNKAAGLHTLLLLDVERPGFDYMTIKQAVIRLQELEAKKKQKLITNSSLLIGCSALGSPRQILFAGTPAELIEQEFGAPPHCLIIPGELHFLETEAISLLKH